MYWHLIPLFGAGQFTMMFVFDWREDPKSELDYTYLVVAGILYLITVHVHLLQGIREHLRTIYVNNKYGATNVAIVSEEKPDAEGEE